jgi:hypothetical protein
MCAMVVHKGIMTATGQQTKPLNVWLYRLFGVTALMVLLGLSFAIGLDAACLLFVLLIGGGLVGLVTRRRNATAAAGAAQGIGPQSLPGVLGELSRRSLDDLRQSLGPPTDPAETDIHLRSADLMAALRYYQLTVDASFTDQQIGNQLAANAPGMMAGVEQSYQRLPASVERDVALQIIRAYLPQGPGVTGNAYTTYAGNALRQHR